MSIGPPYRVYSNSSLREAFAGREADKLRSKRDPRVEPVEWERPARAASHHHVVADWPGTFKRDVSGARDSNVPRRDFVVTIIFLVNTTDATRGEFESLTDWCTILPSAHVFMPSWRIANQFHVRHSNPARFSQSTSSRLIAGMLSRSLALLLHFVPKAVSHRDETDSPKFKRGRIIICETFASVMYPFEWNGWKVHFLRAFHLTLVTTRNAYK